MTKENDFEGNKDPRKVPALKLFDDMMNFIHNCVCRNAGGSYHRNDFLSKGEQEKIRAALTAAKGDGWLPISEAPLMVDIQLSGYEYDDKTKPRWVACGYICEIGEPVCYEGGSVTSAAYADKWKPLDKPPQDGGDDA